MREYFTELLNWWDVLEIDWDNVVTGITGLCAVVAAIWLGRKQIEIARRQTAIAAEQVRISSEQHILTERQTIIMEAQSKLERFQAMRDDLIELMSLKELLVNLRASIVNQDWNKLNIYLQKTVLVESRMAKFLDIRMMHDLILIFDTSEVLYKTRRIHHSELYGHLVHGKYKHENIIRPDWGEENPRVFLIVNIVKKIEISLNTISNKVYDIHGIIDNDYRLY